MNSDLQNKKIELIQWLSTLNEPTMIEKILELRKSEQEDWWSSLSESEKDSIEKGLKDAKAGKLHPHSEARKLYEKWL